MLVDSNVLLDVVTNDRVWAEWSLGQLETLSLSDKLVINPVVYTEISISYRKIEDVERFLQDVRLDMTELPRAALFLAGKAFMKYRSRRGTRNSVLPDFYIGAHAAVMGWPLLTRDAGRYRTYFPTLKLIAPASR